MLSEFAQDVECTKANICSVFKSDRYIPVYLLWHCLMHAEVHTTISNFSEFLQLQDVPRLEENIVQMTSLVRLSCDVLKHVSSLLERQQYDLESIQINKTKFCFLLQEGFGTMDILPKLCLSMLDLVSVSLT
jgi:hypothetical protein